MSKLEELQELKKEKKWNEIIRVYKELSPKEKKSTVAAKSYVDACENLNNFDNDYFLCLKYLSNKSEKKSPFIKKLAEYFKEKDEEEYKEYLFKYVKALAHEKSYSKLEENMLEILENKSLTSNQLYNIVSIISKKGNKELASSISNLVLSDLDLKEDVYYKFIKLLLENKPDDKSLRALFVKYYKEKYKEHKNIDRLLKLSKLMITENLKKAVVDFEDMITFDEGEYVYHNNFGTGRIEKVDYIFDDIKIRFENNVVKKFKRKNLKNAVIHLPKDDYNVYRFDKTDEFKKLIKESSDRAVYIVLKKANKKLSQKELKTFFVPYFISENDWLNEWKEIKKSCEKSDIIAKDLNYNYEIKIGGKGSIIDEILKITDLKKRLFELEKMKENITDEDKERIESTFQTIPNLRAFFFLEKLFPDKYNLEEFMQNKIRTVDRLSRYMTDLVRVKYIFEVFKHAEPIWDDFHEHMGASLSQFPPFVQEQYIEYLFKNNKGDEAEKIIKASLDDIYLNPDLFLIIIKNKLKGEWGGEKDISIVRLFEKLFELYEYVSIEANNEQEKEVKQLYQQLMQKTRDLIRANNYKYFKRAVSEQENENRAKIFVKQIERIENLPVEMQTALKGIVSDKFPTIEKEIEEEVDTFFTLKSSYDKKVLQYKHLIGVEIPENAERIHEAASMGDLSENAEYKAAKEQQKILRNKQRTMKSEIDNAIVTDLKDIKGDFVTFGTEVKLKNSKGEEFRYKILGPWETDLQKNIISYNSSIGLALEGKKAGEVIEVNNDTYEIIAVNRLEKI